jgi:hypothetical protein
MSMDSIRVVDVVDDDAFRLVPPCANPGFDHRSCDFWEDADRGSKAARLAWLQPAGTPSLTAPTAPRSSNPFLADLEAKAPALNPFAVNRPNPFLTPGEDEAPRGQSIRAATACPTNGRAGCAAQAPAAGARPEVVGSYASPAPRRRPRWHTPNSGH